MKLFILRGFGSVLESLYQIYWPSLIKEGNKNQFPSMIFACLLVGLELLLPMMLLLRRLLFFLMFA